MTHSLGEIEALAKKAARGAGLDWATAAEAGAAVRWLSARGIDGTAVLAALIETCAGIERADLSPVIESGEWTGARGLCPLAVGVCLTDRAGDMGAALTLRSVHAPGLALPFAALVAQAARQGVRVTVGGIRFQTDGTGATLDGPVAELETPGDIEIEVIQRPILGITRKTRATPSPAALDCLTTWAHRTYAPATEASRLKGAGAGTTDND